MTDSAYYVLSFRCQNMQKANAAPKNPMQWQRNCSRKSGDGDDLELFATFTSFMYECISESEIVR